MSPYSLLRIVAPVLCVVSASEVLFHDAAPYSYLVTILTFTISGAIALISGRLGRDTVLSHTPRDVQRFSNALQKLITSDTLYSGDLDKAFTEIMTTGADAMGVDQVSIWFFNDERTAITCVKQLNISTGQPKHGQILTADDCPTYFEAIKESRIIVAHDVHTDPRTCDFSHFKEANINSMMDAAIRLDGKLFGLVCHVNIGPHRRWSDEEQQFAASIADIIALAFEVNRRKKSEREAAEMALLARMSPSPILRFDITGRILMANPAAVNTLNLSDVDGALLVDVIPGIEEIDLPGCVVEGHRLSHTANIGDLNYHFVFVGSPEQKHGHVYASDVTDLKKMQEEIVERREFLRTIIDSDPNLIFVKDSEGRYTMINETVAGFYGTTVQEVIGRTDAEVYDKTGGRSMLGQKSEDDVIDRQIKVVLPEERVFDSDGVERCFYAIKQPLKIPGTSETHVLGVVTDITDRKRLEDELAHSQKMEAIGQLAGGIAHDFNNILTGVLGYTNLLMLDHPAETETYRIASKIDEAASRAQELTENLLGFARKGKHQHIPIDIHGTIDAALALLGRTIETNVQINKRYQAPLTHTIGDPGQIQSIVLNLAINARDAMCSEEGGSLGGVLTVETDVIRVTEDSADLVSDLVPGQYIELSVTDSGCGMDQRVLGQIFDPFFTTKKVGRGTGMGLSMVYGIVKNHGGAIRVDSEVGLGTTFRIYLPAVANEVEISSDSAKKIECTHSGEGLILVVDDHQVMREVTARMLHSLGYQVDTVQDGAEAVAYYSKHGHKVDLIIMDMVMPRMGARECFLACKEINPAVRSILTTGYSNNLAVQGIMNEGMLGFLQKPFQIEELSNAIEAALNADVNATVSQVQHVVN